MAAHGPRQMRLSQRVLTLYSIQISMNSVGLDGSWSAADALISKGPHPAQHTCVHEQFGAWRRMVHARCAHPKRSAPCTAFPCPQQNGHSPPSLEQGSLGLHNECFQGSTLSASSIAQRFAASLPVADGPFVHQELSTKGHFDSYKSFYQEALPNCRAPSVLHDLCQHHEMEQES